MLFAIYSSGICYFVLLLTYVSKHMWCVEQSNYRYAKNNTVLGCARNEDCIHNAVCSNHSNSLLTHKYCICDKGYVGFRTRKGDICLKEATQIGDPCDEDIQCAAQFGRDAECKASHVHYPNFSSYGSCECKEGAKFVNNLCEKISKIGGSCRVSDNCPPDVYCDKSICVCPYNHVANSERNKCVRNSNLNEGCLEDRNCLNTNSRCYEGVCKCAHTHVNNFHENMCLKRVGDICSDSRQCMSSSNETDVMYCDLIKFRCECHLGSIGDIAHNRCIQPLVGSSSSSRTVSPPRNVIPVISSLLISCLITRLFFLS